MAAGHQFDGTNNTEHKRPRALTFDQSQSEVNISGGHSMSRDAQKGMIY